MEIFIFDGVSDSMTLWIPEGKTAAVSPGPHQVALKVQTVVVESA